MGSLRCLFVLLISIGVGSALYYPVGGYYGGGVQDGAYRYEQSSVGGPSGSPRFQSFQSGWRFGGGVPIGYFPVSPPNRVGEFAGFGGYGTLGWPFMNGGPRTFRGYGMNGRRFGPGGFGYGDMMYGGRQGFGQQANLDIGGLRSIARRFRGRRMRGLTFEFGGGLNSGFGPSNGHPSSYFGAYNVGFGDTRMGRSPLGYGGFGSGGLGRQGGFRLGGFGRPRFGGFAPRGFGLDGFENGNAGFGDGQFVGEIEGNFVGQRPGKHTCTCRKQCGPGEKFIGKCQNCTKKLCLVKCCRLLPF